MLEMMVLVFGRIMLDNVRNRSMWQIQTGELYGVLGHCWCCRLAFGAILSSQENELCSGKRSFRSGILWQKPSVDTSKLMTSLFLRKEHVAICYSSLSLIEFSAGQWIDLDMSVPVSEGGLLMTGGVCCRDARSVDEIGDEFAFDDGVRVVRCALSEFVLKFFFLPSIR